MSIAGPNDTISRMVVFGSSGYCVQMGFDVRFQLAGALEFVGYVDDDPEPGRTAEGYPVHSFADLLAMPHVGVFVGVGDPTGRRSVFERLAAQGIPVLRSRGIAQLVHPLADIGDGVFVASTTRIAHTARIGRGALVAADDIGHDVIVGEYCSLATRSIIMGHVTLGDAVFIGGGAMVLNGTKDRRVTIGDGAVIGAGAVVDRDIAPGEVIVAPRGMPIGEWAALRSLARRPGKA